MQQAYAHRGSSGEAPENTLEAFDLAIKQGAHGLELDVHISRDGQIVVAHDETIDRVSNGSGLIADMSVAELKRFNYNKACPQYSKGTLPTLEEVYGLLKPSGLHVNVELKNSVLDYPGLEKKCVELAARMGMESRVLYSSFNHYSLKRIKEMDPSIPCGLLYDAVMVAPWDYGIALGMDALHPHYSSLQFDDLCQNAHQAGIRVNPWTVNDMDHIEMALKLGADIVISNYPERVLKAIAKLV